MKDLPATSSKLLIEKTVSTLNKKESKDFVVKLLETQSIDIRMQIISEIEELFANREQFNQDKKKHLVEILSSAKSDSEIKVRSYARLMLKKLNELN